MNLETEAKLPIRQGGAVAPATAGVKPHPHGVFRWPEASRRVGGELAAVF